ncbi:hypothetical protein BDN67DRAFT_960837 [Paxillus ammoniavirescens]|nr:hypothetical protein BDN67DRAFT_960837 [Paxillus ammoniavirescens]
MEILGALLQSIGNERASWRMDDGFLSCFAKVCPIMQRSGRSRLCSNLTGTGTPRTP